MLRGAQCSLFRYNCKTLSIYGLSCYKIYNNNYISDKVSSYITKNCEVMLIIYLPGFWAWAHCSLPHIAYRSGTLRGICAVEPPFLGGLDAAQGCTSVKLSSCRLFGFTTWIVVKQDCLVLLENTLCR